MDDTKRTIPPYIPWQTFLAFIERMKATAVPPVIDHTVLPKMKLAPTIKLARMRR